MGSFAVWCQKKKDFTGDIEAIINVNLWRLPEKNKPRNFRYFIDLGILVSDLGNINNIKVFVPFEINNAEIYDLGNILSADKKLINGVFNEDYQILNDSKAKQVQVQKNRKTEFIIYSLNTSSDIVLIKKYGGTILTINTEQICQRNCEKYYFRFRIVSENFTRALVKSHKSMDTFFHAILTKTDVIDFRLNQKRNLDESLTEEIVRDGGGFNITKIHFLFMTHESDDFITPGLNYTCRELENNIWDKYIGNDYNEENIIAYHWKAVAKEEPLIEFATLARVRFHSINLGTIFRYVVMLVIFTVFCNLLSSYILDWSKKTKDPSEVVSKIDEIYMNGENNDKN